MRTRSRARYCPRCKTVHLGGQHTDSRSCPVCGQTFQPRHAQTLHCSRKCAGIARRLPVPVKTCERCGREWAKRPEYSFAYFETQRFCSRKCRGNSLPQSVVTCAHCDTEFVAGRRKRRFCSTECFQASRHRDPSMRASAKGKFSDACKRLLLERASHVCQQCGSAEHLELDHVIPLAAGGQGVFENGQVLCRVCHLQKCRAERKLVRDLLRVHYGLDVQP